MGKIYKYGWKTLQHQEAAMQKLREEAERQRNELEGWNNLYRLLQQMVAGRGRKLGG